MNGPQTPAYTKDNPFTRLIERVGQLNASEGKPAGRAFSGGDVAAESYVSAIPANRVRSLAPAEAMRLDNIPEPLSPAEIQAASARAAALGIVDPDDLPMPMGNTDTSGGPSEAEIEAMLPSRFRTSTTTVPNRPVEKSREILADVPSGRQFIPQFQTTSLTRGMPNFQNVQGFNLEKGVAVIDGIEYPLPEEDIRDMKKYALTIVLDVMVIQVASALAAFGLTPEQANEAAEKMRESAQNNALTPGSLDGRRDNEQGKDMQSVSSIENNGPVQLELFSEGWAPTHLQKLSSREESPETSTEDENWFLQDSRMEE